MTDQWLNGVVHKNIDGTAERDRVDTSMENVASQLNNYSGATNTYGAYTPADHNWSSRPANGPSDGASEWEYLKSFAYDVAQAHRNGDIYVIDGDVWDIMDGFDLDYGYGGYRAGVDVDLSGDGNRNSTIYVGRAAAMGHSSSSDPNRVTNSMLIQEAAHCFGAEHAHGGYDYSTYISNVTPMATAYVRAVDGNESDTCLAGGSTAPDSFWRCAGEDNKTDRSYCGFCSDWCRHTTSMTDCTMENIDSSAPL